MSNVIQIKRGEGIPNKKLNAYELGFNVKNDCLYIGGGSGTDSNCIPVKVEVAKGLENQPAGVWYKSSNSELTGLTLVTTPLEVGEINPTIGSDSDSKSDNNAVISAGALRWWNGAHTKEEDGTFKSNLQYCDQGRFTKAAVSTIASPATSNSNNASGNGVGPIPASQDNLLINGETIRWWDGSYGVENNKVRSNLAYCTKGAFGDAAIKNITTPNSNSADQYITGPIYDASNELLVNARTLRWWNGQHSDGESNLAYCNKGAFGTFATKNAATFLQTTNDTVSKIVLKGTTEASNDFNDANPKICFYNSSSPSEGISLTYTDYNAVQNPASLTLNGEKDYGVYFIAPFVKTILVATSYGTDDPSGTGAAGQIYFKVV